MEAKTDKTLVITDKESYEVCMMTYNTVESPVEIFHEDDTAINFLKVNDVRCIIIYMYDDLHTHRLLKQLKRSVSSGKVCVYGMYDWFLPKAVHHLHEDLSKPIGEVVKEFLRETELPKIELKSTLKEVTETARKIKQLICKR